MILGECVRCGFASEFDDEDECRAAMVAHTAEVHRYAIPSWFEDDGEIVTRHGMASMNGHQRQEAR